MELPRLRCRVGRHCPSTFPVGSESPRFQYYYAANSVPTLVPGHSPAGAGPVAPLAGVDGEAGDLAGRGSGSQGIAVCRSADASVWNDAAVGCCGVCESSASGGRKTGEGCGQVSDQVVAVLDAHGEADPAVTDAPLLPDLGGNGGMGYQRRVLDPRLV